MAITHPAYDETMSLIAARTDIRAALTEAGADHIINSLTITPTLVVDVYEVQSSTIRIYVQIRTTRTGTRLTWRTAVPVSHSWAYNRRTRIDISVAVAALTH